MSEIVTLPQANLLEAASVAAPTPSPTAPPVAGTAEHGIASAPVVALPAAVPPEAHALLEIVSRGLAPDADESTRQAARELCAQLAHSLATAAPVPTAVPVMPPAPVIPPLPTMPAASLPTSPIAMAARALRQLPPDQLLELLLQRLRGALPAGAPVPPPKGIQFQLVPMTPPPGSR